MGRIRYVGFWGFLTLVLIYIVVGNLVERVFPHMNSLAAEITGNVVGAIAALAYLFYWRRRFKRHHFTGDR